MNTEAKANVVSEVLFTYDQAFAEVKKRWIEHQVHIQPDRGDYIFIAKTTVLAIARLRTDPISVLDSKKFSLHFYEPFTVVEEGTTIVKDSALARKYLPTLSDLVDRLTIVQQKMIFIPERAEEYTEERASIIHDIDILLQSGHAMTGKAIAAVAVIMLTNRVIWENESLARKGGSEQDKMLKFTHSINGVRNSAKNVLASEMGGRKDYKIDSFAAEFGDAFGNWDVLQNL